MGALWHLAQDTVCDHRPTIKNYMKEVRETTGANLSQRKVLLFLNNVDTGLVDFYELTRHEQPLRP